MSSIPLPALATQAPPNPLDQYSKILEMKSLLGSQQMQQQQLTAATQENQMRAMQLQDQQTIHSLASKHVQKDADGNITGYDFDGLINDASSAGVMPQSLAPLISQRKNIADTMVAQEAAKKGALDNQEKMNDELSGKLEAYRSAPLNMKQSALQDAMQTSQKYGIPWKLPTDPAQITDDQLNTVETGLAMHSQHIKDAQAISSTREANAKAALDEMKAKGLQASPADIHNAVAGVVPANWSDPTLAQRTESRMNSARAMGDLDGMNKALADASSEIGAVKKETNPAVQQGKVDVATAEGTARANIEAQVARGSQAALATVPPHLVAPATAAATKAGEDYAQAQSVSQRLQAMMDAAKNGNVVSYQLIPEEGALQVTTSQGVHRINMAEIQNYGGGSLWQRMQGHLGKTLTGASIPESVLTDMSEMQKIQQAGAQAKYNNSLKTINDTYGAQFKPVQMETTTPSTVQHVPGGKAQGLPEGQTGKGSDGKNYIVKGGVWVAQP